MRLFETVLLIIMIGALLLGVYLLMDFWNKKTVDFQSFNAELTANLSDKTNQFYPNMRYPDKLITYSIGGSCTDSNKIEIMSALATLSSKTVLRFSEKDNGEIKYFCSNIQPSAEEEGHFIAGEGGPSEIINESVYFVILSGKVALYKPTNCDKPNVAIHETLHALGFDHTNKSSSIMYPITNCNQEIDQSISDEINRIYSIPSEADLLIESLDANIVGRYLNFNITVSNLGFKDADNAILKVYSEDKLVKDFSLNNIDFGTRKLLSVSVMLVGSNSRNLKFEVYTSDGEISKTNNVKTLQIKA